MERKRHLGNDVVNIIFNDSGLPFDPTSIVTNFIRLFYFFLLFLVFLFSYFVLDTYIVVSQDEEATKENNGPHYRYFSFFKIFDFLFILLFSFSSVEIVNQTQVPKYNPPLRNPPIFSKVELKEWLPSKCKFLLIVFL